MAGKSPKSKERKRYGNPYRLTVKNSSPYRSSLQPNHSRSRETYKLRIPWPPIRANAFPPKPVLHNHLPRLIKAQVPLLHHPQHLLLPRLIKTRSFVSTDNIIGDVEVCAVEAGFDVATEGGRDWCVAVEVECGDEDRWTWETGDGFAGLREPAGAGEVEDWCGC